MRVPTLVDQSDAVRAEMDKISRTASTGAVDSSVSPDKPRPDMLCAERGDGVRDALSILGALDTRCFSAEAMLSVNAALISEHYSSATYRAHESPRYGYLPSDRIRDDVSRFVLWVRGLDEDSDPSHSVAWTHLCINLRGHYFSDGCSRTAIVVGAWISTALTGSVLKLPPRAEYLSSAASGVRQLQRAVEASNPT